jgi:adenylosuccinate synthase
VTTAYLTAGLQFGDEGKGSCIDFLVRTTGSKLVVRYNGGPQCGHNVVTKGGLHHCFAQFGAGTLAGASTYLSRFMMIEPFALRNEHQELEYKIGKPLWDRIFVEESAPVITPFHWKMNRLREQSRGRSRHGSCGMGVGELRADQTEGKAFIAAGELVASSVVEDKLRQIQKDKLREAAALGHSIDYRTWLDENVQAIAGVYRETATQIQIVPDGSLSAMEGPFVFEGAQGMLLDETYGFAPYNTWTDITFRNALELLSGMRCDVTRIGVLRTYMTRHGAGPFPTEDASMAYPDHNCSGEWQGDFRQGHFDLALARYALRSISGVDGLAVTHIDHQDEIRYSSSYYLGNREFADPGAMLTQDLMMARPVRYETASVDEIAELLGTEIHLASHGPTANDKQMLVRAY